MLITLKEHKEFLIRLLSAQIEFILIGGYAVNYHGYNRYTGDMDVWLRPDNQNRDRLLDMLWNEGFQNELIDQLRAFNFSEPMVFHIGEPPKRIDFLTVISNVNFTDAWEQKQLLPLENVFVPVLHLQHLILSKIANNRSRDKTDVEELQKIEQLRKKNGS